MSRERKKISELYFEYSKALEGLNKINTELEKLNTTSNTVFGNIKRNLENSFNVNEKRNVENYKKNLKTISGYTTQFGEKMKYTLSSIDFSKFIDVGKVKKSLDKIDEYTSSQAKRIGTTIVTENIKTTGVKEREAAKRLTIDKDALNKQLLNEQKISNYKKITAIDLDAFREKQLIKEETRNKRQLESTKTLYDKITNYAKTYLIYQGFNELKRGAKELVEEMVNVQYRMVEIDRVLNDNSLNIDNYRDKLIKLAYDYGNSFENVSDITLRLAQAGFKADESLALTEKTLLALNTAELNATQATSDMVAVMSQWNLMTGDATEKSEKYAAIIDKINKVADNFPTTSEDILNALKKTSSAFNLAGASIDETIALITTAEIASQRGGKAIGTAMSNIIQQLKAEGRLNIMETLGIDVYTDETKQEFNSIVEIITQLSEKMQQLKADGKENSVEMKNLLDVFTVFRRNIGAGLLSGVSGEDSKYAEILKTSMDSLGYSIQENEKHLKTAKAAQAQFNATVLELKTTVWDAGAEDVFRSMLLLGSDVANGFKTLIDTFGELPVAIGAVTLAFSTLNKNMKIAQNVNVTTIEGNKKTIRQYNDWILKIKEVITQLKYQNTTLELTSNGTIKAQTNIGAMTKGLVNMTKQTTVATLKTIGLEAATIALNAALSLGLSFAIAGVIAFLDNLIHKEEKAREKSEQLITTAQDNINKTKEEVDTIDELIKKYNELNAIPKSERTKEQIDELEVIQSQITKQLKIQGEYTDELNDKYDDQLKKIKEISSEKIKQQIQEQKQIINEQQKLNKPISKITGGYEGVAVDSQLRTIQNEVTLSQFFKIKNVKEQIKVLEEWQEELEISKKQGKEVSEAYNWVSESLSNLRKNQEKVVAEQENLNDLLGEQKYKELISDKNIKTLDDYKKILEDIAKIEPPDDWTGTVEEYRKVIENLIRKTFPDLQTQLDSANGSFSSANTILRDNLKTLDDLNSKYNILVEAVNEFNTTGQITSSTLQNLVNNNLLQYLDLSTSKIRVNVQALQNLAEESKINAISALQDAAAKDIEKVATGDLANVSDIAKAALIQFGNNAQEIGNKSINSAQKVQELAKALQNAADAAKGNLGKSVDTSAFEKQSKAIINAYTNYAKQISKLDITSSTYESSKSGSKSMTNTFEEQSKERVKIFKEEIDDLESLEKSWVNKYKKLELFSTSDLKFITHQRINRYNEYLNQINNLTGISEEDRTDLIREYSLKRQEAELEYFDLLKSQLDDQISKFKKANEEKIKLIKDEADARIDSLKKVEDENDRIRQKEEYERKRSELIHGNQGIEYWQQRTGREAQLALAEAQKELEELDKDWNEKQKDWTLEDQIEEIEKARDAQVKAIEDAQEKQIQGWKNAYEAQVQLYAQTGEILYDDSVINAEYLYNAYMDNFVSPFHAQLQNVVNSINAASAAADGVISKMNTITSGGGSIGNVSNAIYGQVYGPQQISQAAINRANQFSGLTTTSGKSTTGIILEANSVSSNIKSSVSSSNSLWDKIKNKVTSFINPKNTAMFHGGGIVGSSTEGLALLRPKEVVLTPEWAAGMNKLVKQINEGSFTGGNSTNNNIDVRGNLVNIDAKIKNKQDADYLTEQVEKVLRDKFNIRK